MTPTYRIRSVADYVRVACEIREEWSTQEGEYFDPWFRGVRDASWGLQPSLYRLDLGTSEDDMRVEFKRRAVQLLAIEREPGSEWAWYFLMQHHGAPTRLLDWTDSALVALFFAVNSGPPATPSREEAAVWVLNPYWLNRRVLNVDNPIQPDWPQALEYLWPSQLTRELPAAIDPAHTARRISAQASRFTIHGTRPDGITDVCADTGHLRKLVVPRRLLNRVRTDLRTCGVVDTAVFPDLEGLSRDLLRYWKTPWPLD